MEQGICHNTRRRHLGWAVLVALVVGGPQALAAEEITGDWEITMDFGGRQTFATLSIANKADATLTGKWGNSDLSNVKFDGQKLTFVRTVRFGDQEFSLNYTGTLKDGKLTGTLSSDQGDFAANGARKKPKSPVLGQWDLSYQIGDRDVTAKLSLSQKPDGSLEAKWTSEFGESVVSNVKAQDGKLRFSRKVTFNDNSFETTFEGTVKDDKLAGTSKSERGEVAVTGLRVGTALIGKWELTSKTDQGTFTNLLIVEPDLSARYEFFGGEIPVKDVKLEGNQVSFKVPIGFGDQTSEIDFKAKLDGKALKGQTTSEWGTAEVTGKKMEAAAGTMAAVASTASPLVGTWELTSETPQGTRTNTLKIKADMTGTYSFRENETPITDLKVEADQVSFKVTRQFNDQTVTLEFKGKLDGATLKGEMISERGNRTVTGKKVN